MDSLIGTIVGGLVTFLTVWITLKNNEKLQENNIKEERGKIKNEREFTAKQNVLVAACDAVTKFILYYLSLADRTLPKDGEPVSEVNELNIAMNRLHFYCNLETIEKTIELNKILNIAFTNVLQAKMPAIFVTNELNDIDFQIASIEKININLQEEIKFYIQFDPSNQILISHREHLAQNANQIYELYLKKPHLTKERYIQIEKCRDVIVTHLKEIYTVLQEMLLTARNELSFNIEGDKYKRIMGDATNIMSKRYDNVLTEIRKTALEKFGDIKV